MSLFERTCVCVLACMCLLCLLSGSERRVRYGQCDLATPPSLALLQGFAYQPLILPDL